VNLNRRTLIKGGSALAAAGVLGMPAVRAQGKPIKIGVMFPLSGPQATVGVPWAMGSEIAIEQINKTGGLLGRPVEAVVRDDKGTSVGAVAAAQELRDMGVNLFIGGNQSPMALGLVPLLPEMNAVMVGNATAMALTHEAFTKHFFRINPNAHMFYGGLGQVVGMRNPDVSTWAFIVFDSAAGRDAVAAFAGGLKKTSKANLKFLDPIFASPTAADFKVDIGNIMSSGADGLYLGLLGGPAISFLQQARSVGLTQKLKAIGEGGTDLSLGRALQKNMPSTVWGRGYWYPQDPTFDNPISAKLYQDYVAKTGEKHPLGIVQLGHKLALGLFAAVQKANSTETKAVIDALEGLEFDCAEGRQLVRKEDHQTLGMGHYANYAPMKEEPFHGVREVVRLPDADTVEPPAPGVGFKPE
jgi:branched-chain amino acid transport system substrate-binding protein